MTQMAAQPALDEVLTALRSSHDRLVATLTPLTAQQITCPSYDTDWTIAQVASRMGSGAEVFGLFIDAGLQQAPAPGVQQFQPVWDRWNAKTASDQARDVMDADAALLDRVDALSDRDRWRLHLFGTEQTLAGLLRMRLAEHALHTWDITVAIDPAATVTADATELVIDNLHGLVDRVGEGAPQRVTVRVFTTEPTREFLLTLSTQSARLSPAPADPAGATVALRLPGEAFVRLVYGRLDPDHTPTSVETDGLDLDTLRAAFPGV